MAYRRYSFEVWDNEENVTRDIVRDALELSKLELKERSFYGPYLEQYPIMVDEQAPRYRMDDLRDHDSPACTDSNNVFLSTEGTVKIIKQGMANARNNHINLYGNNIVDNLNTIIAHEYIHIVCQHRRILEKFKTMTGPEQTCAILAADIEANRGHMVSKDSAVYLCGVTDDKFPETKKDKYFHEIYATLLKQYNEQRQLMEQLAQMLKDAGMDGMGEDNNNSEGEENGQKGDKNQGQVQGKPQGNDSNSKENNGSTTISSVNRQQNSGEDIDSNGGKWEELTQDKIEESIKNASKIVDEVNKEVNGDERGIGLESPYVQYKPELTANQMIEDNYKRWNKKEVKKELAKLKGLIKGTVSKNREKTYARPSRRPLTGAGSLIRKGVKYEKSYSPKVLIAMDSSGSMQSTTMKEVACAIENIFKDLGKPKAGSYICKHESNVSDTMPMRQWKKVVDSYRPCGGNCFTHVVEEANKLGVDVVINIGDGQDCIVRGDYSSASIDTFKNNNRKWYDVLVTSKNNNSYYREEAEHDKQQGFEREAIYLGDEITKYLK